MGDHLPPETLAERLPGISETAKIFAGVDVTKEPAPVLPTVHYNMGGISLLDLVVFGRQAADTTAELVKPNSPPVVMPANAGEASIARLDKIWNQKGSLNTATLRRELQNAMQKHAPVYRNGKDLHDGKAVLQDIMRKYKDVNCVDKQNLVWNTDLVETMELENLIGQAAQGLYSGEARHESRGAHAH